jgi:hypothetical protein
LINRRFVGLIAALLGALGLLLTTEAVLPLQSGDLLPPSAVAVVRSGSFGSVGELVRDINAYLADRNANPKRYEWKAEGADILEKIQRARAALEATKAQLVNGPRGSEAALRFPQTNWLSPPSATTTCPLSQH